MALERTLLIIKPDVASTPEAVKAILIRVIAVDLLPIALQRSTMTTAQAERLYEAHVGQPYYARNVEFMTSGPSVQVVLEREEACPLLRYLIGPTDPKDRQGVLDKFGLRAQFGTDLPRNAVHASANTRDAEREIGIFFPTTLRPEYKNGK